MVVQPIEKGMVDILNTQDGLYHVNLQGIDKGEAVDSIQMIDVINGGVNPYTQNAEYMALAEDPNIRFVISNTTEAGIAFDPSCKLEDKPASSYPGKLTQLLSQLLPSSLQIRLVLMYCSYLARLLIMKERLLC